MTAGAAHTLNANYFPWARLELTLPLLCSGIDPNDHMFPVFFNLERSGEFFPPNSTLQLPLPPPPPPT